MAPSRKSAAGQQGNQSPVSMTKSVRRLLLFGPTSVFVCGGWFKSMKLVPGLQFGSAQTSPKPPPAPTTHLTSTAASGSTKLTSKLTDSKALATSVPSTVERDSPAIVPNKTPKRTAPPSLVPAPQEGHDEAIQISPNGRPRRSAATASKCATFACFSWHCLVATQCPFFVLLPLCSIAFQEHECHVNVIVRTLFFSV